MLKVGQSWENVGRWIFGLVFFFFFFFASFRSSSSHTRERSKLTDIPTKLGLSGIHEDLYTHLMCTLAEWPSTMCIFIHVKAINP